ncbi:hypothetical protein ACIP98_15075 [Streptomyces sp. NPDC088354]|uniref:hypothetical protein n=1 Tax=unclassified Streptomyces TaxID=2593676 RepID=UPI0029A54136|nr:hypothetical protein [Streptomyces sp. MI02-7b]MDX3077390.1 hypothetical protein [Streptomyces sp. MI02-7b]
MRKHPIRPLAAVTLIASVPVAVWGLLGRQEAAGFRPSELDYLVRPLDVPAGVETGLGVVAALLAVAAATVLGMASRPGPERFDGRWWQVLGPLVAAGALAGAGWRVVTAGVIGANIGAGLVILLGGPLVAALLAWSAGRGLWLARARRRGPRPPRGGTGTASWRPVPREGV